MSVFFDTSVLVYAVDRAHAGRRSIARDLLDRHVRAQSLVVSTQVLQEFYAVAIRRRLLEPADALEMVTALARETVVPSSGAFVVRAIALAQRHRLSSWDGLIVQAALDARCSVLLSEDLAAGTRYGQLEVVNPFAPTANESVPAASPAEPPARTARQRRPERTDRARAASTSSQKDGRS